ncbi:hypothetical protein DT603_04270 [Pseudoxanthomonas gei]|uniref:SMODS and SLOG-associating 2TM effector domain-containing protein n=1 Tax=Pseudoxanthomonas gei TaxID=1383030 RepID=A0ABX0AD16_9GAMM|nr:hypothetical protein [Pseudoxanthomonas gei]NDK38055.1 hypothetical protein [Pseudoxanthomonas gei]
MSDRNDVPLLANSLVLGVTGHRRLRSADVPGLQARVRTFLEDLQARHPELPLVLLSPMAQGSDQLVAQVALDLGLRVIAPLPLPLSTYREDFDAPDLQWLERQLPRVEVLELPLERGSTPQSVAVPGLDRDRQYAQAGIFVSSHCHVLLALWDGQESGRLGGTAQIVRFHLHGAMFGGAERRHATANLLGPDHENVVHHMHTARQGDGDVSDPGGRWLTAAEGTQASEELQPEFAQMLHRQADYNVDVHKYAAQIAAQPADSAQAAQCPVWKTFIAADWLARTYQRRVGRVLRSTYALVALMGFAFFTYTHVVTQDVVIYTFLLLFLIGMGVTGLASRRQWQRKYLDYRTLAEGLRVQSYWRRAGIVVPGTPAFAHDNFLQKQDVELGWIRNVMRGASLDGMLAPVMADAGHVDAVIGEWIGTSRSGGQLGYYSHSALRRSRLHHRAELMGHVCIGLGVALSVLLAILAHRFDDHLKHTLVSVMGILSVIAAVHEAYVHKKADKELIRQYRFMQRIFAAAQRLLDSARGLEEKRGILRALGEAALTEHAEWSLMHRERPLPTSRI